MERLSLRNATDTGMNSTTNIVKKMEEAGLKIAGTSPDGRLVEAVELPQHPHYVGVQYHPEFKSRPNKAHPLFREFIAAALKQK